MFLCLMLSFMSLHVSQMGSRKNGCGWEQEQMHLQEWKETQNVNWNLGRHTKTHVCLLPYWGSMPWPYRNWCLYHIVLHALVPWAKLSDTQHQLSELPHLYLPNIMQNISCELCKLRIIQRISKKHGLA